jgi:hypothetical protein
MNQLIAGIVVALLVAAYLFGWMSKEVIND